MAIRELNETQIRTWGVDQKDRWWLENIYQGDVPQFTFRACVCGFLLGLVLSMTNLYVGAKTGWTVGIGLTSAVLSWVFFRAIASSWNTLRPGKPLKPLHVLENNIIQSIAAAAGYMTMPLISSMAAYMILASEAAGEPVIIPWPQTLVWLFVLAILGVVFAVPLKRRFINDEQQPFPEGRATAFVLDALHDATSNAHLAPKFLFWSGVAAALATLGQAKETLASWGLKYQLIPHYLDQWLYDLCTKFGCSPNILGTSLKQLTVRPGLDIAMIGVGGLMGIRTGVSLLIGACINYLILAPIFIDKGDIQGVVSDGGELIFGFRQISAWSVWAGVAMMTTASLYTFFSNTKLLRNSFRSARMNRGEEERPVERIEIPMWVFFLGLPIVGAAAVWMAHSFFQINYLCGIIAIPLVFAFSLIAASSTAMTSITPVGPIGKLTQLTFSVIAPGNISTNLMTASIAGEVSSNASNLLTSLKPGYMLGAKPRLQALAHCLGAVCGAIASVAVFYPLILRGNPLGLMSEQYPMPAAAIWKAVAQILTQGIGILPRSALYAAFIGAILGVVLEVIRSRTKGKFPLSGVGIGLAFVIPFSPCFAMFSGAFAFWLIEKYLSGKRRFKDVLDNRESICAGMIAGAALLGIGVMAYELSILGN